MSFLRDLRKTMLLFNTIPILHDKRLSFYLSDRFIMQT